MRIARNDWKKHTKADFEAFGNQTKRFAYFLVDLFEDTLYSIVWADDYSDDPRIAQDSGTGDNRFVGWLEIMGPVDSIPPFQRVGYLRLHLDDHVEIDRATFAFSEFITEPLRKYNK